MTTLTIPALLEARAGAVPAAEPLLEDGERPLSYQDWDRRSHAAAAALVEAGVAPEARVGLYFSPGAWLDYAVAYVAVHRAGAVAVHLNPGLGDVEIARRVDLCAVDWLFHGSDVALPSTGSVRSVGGVVLPDADADPPSGWSALDGSPCGAADIRFTSGTTGTAKAYVVSHDNLTFGRTIVGMDRFGGGGSMLVPIRLGTSSGATVLSIGLSSAVQLVLADPDGTDRLGELVESLGVGSVMLNPHVAGAMVRADLAHRYDFASVTALASAAAPLPPVVARALLAAVPGAKLEIACAMSEASPAIVTGSFDPERPFAVGRAAPNTEVRVVDEAGEAIEEGLGELWLRSEAPKRLYLEPVDLNVDILAGGWYRTGDLVEIGRSGLLEFFDRRADTIDHDGRMRSSVRWEAALAEIPGVDAVAVVAPHPTPDAGSSGSASEVVACVVPEAEVDLGALRRRLLEADTSEGRVTAVSYRDSLPVTQTGKVLKRQLRRWLESGGDQTGHEVVALSGAQAQD